MTKTTEKRSSWIRKLFWGSAIIISLFCAIAVAGFAYVGVAAKRIDERMEQLRNLRPTQFYALSPSFRAGQRFSEEELRAFIADQGYVSRASSAELSPGDYQWVSNGGIVKLILFRPDFKAPGHAFNQLKAELVFEVIGKDFTLISMARQDKQEPIEEFENLPKRVGSFFAGRPRTQDSVTLSDIPASARLAVIAIEDVRFLEHHGVSLRGTLRALWQDLKARKFVQGGSTLTQQLMKNLLFSNKKAVTRKIEEALCAFIVEQRHSKEAILEAYLNEVYLGQWGTREIHGFSEGSQYYFNRPVSELSLSQSATLAAVVQAPRSQDPHRYPDRLVKRRNLVLKQMLDAGFILPDEYAEAAASPLGVVPRERALNDVYYAIDLIVERLPPDIRSQLDSQAFTIYVTINPHLQALASKALNDNLERLRKYSPAIKKKEQRKIHLQGALIAIDVKDCSILALQGGSSYQQTQFNRVVQGKRQPGSLFKPFVYLSAFAKHSSQTPLTPSTLIDDSKFEWKYERQTWSPRNYDNKFRGPVTLRQALEESINVPTAKLAQQVGVDPIVDTMINAGILSPIPKVPSIALGSAEVTPLELAEAYTTLANLGRSCKLRPYTEIFDANGNLVGDNKPTWEQKLSPQATFQTVQLMKGVLTHGTAKSALASGLPLNHFAGKTGTTNDLKDAWFVGFSPRLLVLVWIGYDEQEKVGLAGSVAALPLWINFVKNAQLFTGTDDFQAPEGLKPVAIDRNSNPTTATKCKDVVVDYFVPGSEPKTDCELPRP